MPEDQKVETPSLKIGAFAKRAGTNIRTLRYYEELGLLRPAARSEGGSRYYRETDVHRFAMIQKLQQLGLPLERISELLLVEARQVDRAAFLENVRGALVQQEEYLARRAKRISKQRSEIASALAKLGECDHCQLRPGEGNNGCEPCPIDGQPLPADLSALFHP